MKNIYIYIESNRETKKILTFLEVKKEIEKKTKKIETNCLDFFCFDVLKKGYEVIILKDNEYIILSELLHKELHLKYINKEIRMAHNVRKMLVSGAFNFRKGKPFIKKIEEF